MFLSFFCYNYKIINIYPIYLYYFFYYRIFRKVFFFIFKFFFKFFYDSFLFYEFEVVDLIFFSSFNFSFFNYYCFLDRYNLPLETMWNSPGRVIMNLFEVKKRGLHFGFFSKSFLSLYSLSFFVVPLYNGFFFFLDIFSFYFFFLVSSYVKNNYFHNYLSLVLFFDCDLIIYFYLFVLNSNNNSFIFLRKFTMMDLSLFWIFFLDCYFIGLLFYYLWDLDPEGLLIFFLIVLIRILYLI